MHIDAAAAYATGGRIKQDAMSMNTSKALLENRETVMSRRGD